MGTRYGMLGFTTQGRTCRRCAVGRLAMLVFVIVLIGCSRDASEPTNPSVTISPNPPGMVGGPQFGRPGAPNLLKTGLLVNDAKASQGYTLIAPLTSTSTYLIDMDSRIVHAWKSDALPSL